MKCRFIVLATFLFFCKLTHAATVSYTATETTFDAYVSGHCRILEWGQQQEITTISFGSWTLYVNEDWWHKQDPFISSRVRLSYTDGADVSSFYTDVNFGHDRGSTIDNTFYQFSFLDGTGGTAYDTILRPPEGPWKSPETYTQLISWGPSADFYIHIHAEITPVPEPSIAGLLLLPFGFQAARSLRNRKIVP